MIRTELCVLAGMSVPTFNAHLSAGELPFETSGQGEVLDAEGRVWANFSLNHVVLLLASHQLVSAA